MLEADNVSLALDLSSLLTGNLLIDQVYFVSAELSVEVRDGTSSLQFNEPGSEGPRPVLPEFLRITRLVVDDGLITVSRNGLVHRVAVDSADLLSKSREAELEVSVRGAYRGVNVEFSGAVNSVDTLVKLTPSAVAVSGYFGSKDNRFARR